MRTIFIAISITLGSLVTALFANECCDHLHQIENMVEKQIELECWMTTPFDANLAEEELVLECWMTTPFELINTEDVVEIEHCI